MAKDRVKGDHNVFQAGSMMVKFCQNNYHHIRGTWTNEEDEDYTEFEEVAPDTPVSAEEPNYFQTERFLRRIMEEEWFEDLRTNVCYNNRWREGFITDFMDSQWKREIALMWEKRDKREKLKGYIMGCLKDAEVISGTYDAIARYAGYEGTEARTFSRYMSDGKRQHFYEWIEDYVTRH